MPPRRKTNLSRLTARARKMKRKRAAESQIEREKRLARDRLRKAYTRAKETPEQREERLKIGRIRMRLSRKNRTSRMKLKSEGNSSNSSKGEKGKDFLLDEKLLIRINCNYEEVGKKIQSSVNPSKVPDCTETVIIKLEPPSSPLPFLPV